MKARARAAVGALLVVLGVLVGGPAVGDEPEWRAPATVDGWPELPPASARAVMLVDADTGQVLGEREADRLLPVASTVKVLTVLTALRELEFDQVVTVGEEVAVGGAGVGLAPGDQWTVQQLVDAVLVRSGNDAALALAAAASDGDLDAFSARMEDVAAELGADGVVVTEPTGLNDENRLSARHLATLARAALDDPRLAASAAQPAVELPGLGVQATRNLLIGAYQGADGLKTGYTDLSGYSLVGSATRDEGALVAVVLGARGEEDRFTEAGALFDLAYDRLAVTPFTPLRVRRTGEWIATDAPIRVWHPTGTEVEVALAGTAESPTAVADLAETRLATTALPDDAPATDPPSVGAALTDALYRGMRAAHRADLWPDGGSSAAVDAG